MKEIKLKECPCCGGETNFQYGIGFLKQQIRVTCSKCKLSTEWVDESVDYCAKEEAAEVWNRRVDCEKLCNACGSSNVEVVRTYAVGEILNEFTKCVLCGRILEVKNEK